MAFGQIYDMDVVAHAGAVGGVVVVAENAEFLAQSDRGLRNVGHQIVRDSVGVLAYAAARMRTDGVKVAQQHHVPFGVGLLHVAQDFFEHGLCFAVGIGAFALGAGLGDRNHGGVAVNGRGTRENDVLDAVLAHGVDQHEGGVHVVLVVFERLGDGLAHGLEAREMDAGVNLEFFENGIHGGCVAHVGLYKGHWLTDDFGDAAEGFFAGIAEVVDDHHGMAGSVEFDNCVAADIAGTTCKQDLHAKNLFFSNIQKKSDWRQAWNDRPASGLERPPTLLFLVNYINLRAPGSTFL